MLRRLMVRTLATLTLTLALGVVPSIARAPEAPLARAIR